MLILVVYSPVAEVIVVLDIDGTMDDWLHHVNEEEAGNSWENKPHPITR